MNADYPGAIVFEARNYGFGGKPGRLNQPKGWVIHTPEEPADERPNTPAYFATTDRLASTHYFVSFLGFVYQCVPERSGAYANTVEGKPYPEWADPHTNLNLQTLNVEVEGYAATIGRTMSAPQAKALADLIRHRSLEYNIPVDRAHIIGHYEVSVNRSDPGTLDLNRLVGLVQGTGPRTGGFLDALTPERQDEIARKIDTIFTKSHEAESLLLKIAAGAGVSAGAIVALIGERLVG